MIQTTRPDMDAKLPAIWKTGKVELFFKNGISGVYLFADNEKFDLPQFCIKFANRECKLLCREYEKKVGGKVYRKLIVISISVVKRGENDSR